MGGFSLRVKTKEGQHVLSTLTETSTVGNLKTKITELTKIPEAGLNVLIGFPPKPLDLTDSSKTIKISGISNGDTLIVDEKAISVEVIAAQSSSIHDDLRVAQEMAAENDEYMGILLKKVVPADNSCLFTSIGYVLNGKIDTDCGAYMREIIAKQVESDKETYSEAFLGRPNLEYSIWIQQPETWGGAIEVSILSKFFGIEIAVVDIANAIINRFGEDKNYGMRVFLLFDGIHYDPLFLESMSVSSRVTKSI